MFTGSILIDKFYFVLFLSEFYWKGTMNEIYVDNLDITGVQVNYYFICKTKLWLFSNYIKMEEESELVKLGKLTHQSSYNREEKEVNLGPIKFDFVKRKECLEIHEVKKSKKMKKSHKYQILYYLYYLDQLGIKAHGILEYPKIKEKEKIKLTDSDKKEIKTLIKEIREILNKDTFPSPNWKKICKKCAYREFCFS
ncbi:MAG: CRISPR-associated protein Cas4, RecB family nuclease [Candidatus Methanohalarchaeum thermophilum]|uniref:CRISPR-associated exonuclease Cas4 n=1 Tax=Methanohalarchaeum thermophilum TaxID=1903181 RepID=A0A1Q6DWP0_METT1|nr:MAG: CRISPR-associated protein Cas4, RecB family nuclease [Candidatus Methanohalarchaeum thermophilum]